MRIKQLQYQYSISKKFEFVHQLKYYYDEKIYILYDIMCPMNKLQEVHTL